MKEERSRTGSLRIFIKKNVFPECRSVTLDGSRPKSNLEVQQVL